VTVGKRALAAAAAVVLLAGCGSLVVDRNDRVFGGMGRSGDLVEAAPIELRGAMTRDHAIAIASHVSGKPSNAVASATLGRFQSGLLRESPSIVWAIVWQDASTWQAILVDAFRGDHVSQMSGSR
jgi:hypothetical protein